MTWSWESGDMATRGKLKVLGNMNERKGKRRNHNVEKRLEKGRFLGFELFFHKACTIYIYPSYRSPTLRMLQEIDLRKRLTVNVASVETLGALKRSLEAKAGIYILNYITCNKQDSLSRIICPRSSVILFPLQINFSYDTVCIYIQEHLLSAIICQQENSWLQ